MLNYNELGAKEILGNTGTPSIVRFGVLLPGVISPDFTLQVNCVPESEFYNASKPRRFEMSFDPTNPNGFWKAEIITTDLSKQHKMTETYVYWYTLIDARGKVVMDHFLDPFAREFGFGKYSAFTLNYKTHEWATIEEEWKTPLLKDLVVYELHINEFGKNIEGCIARLPYLRDLGVNCIQIMPVNNVIDTVNWGYLPLAHFGIDERFGNRKNLQLLVERAHRHGIAVVLDVIFGHTARGFTYFELYRKESDAGVTTRFGVPSPFCTDNKAWGGVLVDFHLPLPFQYAEAVMHNFFDNYHVDGFRFDCVSEYFDAFKTVVKSARDLVKKNDWTRFRRREPILCAEYLAGNNHPPQEVLEQTECNCCCQNDTYNVCTNLASSLKWANSDGVRDNIRYLGESNFSNHFFPLASGKYPYVYLEGHDHGRLVCRFYDTADGHENDRLFEDYCWTYKQRDKYWFKVQPFLIGLFTCRGIPFLWQGQELVENYYLDEDDRQISRVKIFRDVRWEYFFDTAGRIVHDLVKQLIHIRMENRAFFVDGDYQVLNFNQVQNLLGFARINENNSAYVLLNFSESPQEVEMPRDMTGYSDLLSGDQLGSGKKVKVNSNYGRVMVKS